MSELIPATTFTTSHRDAFQEWTHFLDQRGIHSHHIAQPLSEPRDWPSPERPTSAKQEVAWLHTEQFIEVSIDTLGEVETLTSARHKVGNLLLATMRDEAGNYHFRSIEELGQDDDLPIYTAAWLSRYIKTWRRDFFGHLNHPAELHQLKTMPSMTLLKHDEIRELFPQHREEKDFQKLDSFAKEERTRRLAYELVWAEPHLGPWYEARGILLQNARTYEAVVEVMKD